MQPRNRYERNVVALSTKLPKLSMKQIGYAIEHCFSHDAAVKSAKHHTYYCLDCGEVFSDESSTGIVTCPHCGHKLTVKGVRKKTTITKSLQIVTKKEDFFVFRTFYFLKTTQWKHQAEYKFFEVIQRYIKPGKPVVVMARSNIQNWYYYDLFSYFSPLSIKKNLSKYDFDAFATYGMSRLLPILKRNGYSEVLEKGKSFQLVCERLLGNPHWETVVKKGRLDIWNYVTTKELDNYWPQVKMIMRNNYIPSDITMWVDMLKLAKKYHLDYFSPNIVMAKNLKKVHDTYLHVHLEVERKKREREEALEAKRRAEEKARKEEAERQYEKKYAKINKRWLPIVITSGNITIKPLQNRQEFIEEGEKMHHCVSMYFQREDSLILSARQNGKRIATIELNKKDFSVVQCRSYCNEVPERYDELLSIMEQNKKLFKRK